MPWRRPRIGDGVEPDASRAVWLRHERNASGAGLSLLLRLTRKALAARLGFTPDLAIPLALPPLDSDQWQSPPRVFALGLRSIVTSVLTYVLFATFIGIGALAHDTGFSLGWALLGSALIWAGPAQVILMSSLHSGATVIQAALAVTVTAVRLMPMVVSLLPMMKTPKTKYYHLILPAHFTAVTFWVEGFRLFPKVPREQRIIFANGLGTGFVFVCLIATTIGYQTAAQLPPIFGVAVLALTPLTFLY